MKQLLEKSFSEEAAEAVVIDRCNSGSSQLLVQLLLLSMGKTWLAVVLQVFALAWIA